MTYEKNGLYVDESHLEHYAGNCARALRVVGRQDGKARAAALRRSLRELEEIHAGLALKWSDVPAMPGAVRWLLDNEYLAVREGGLAASALEGAEGLLRTASGPALTEACTALLRSGLGELTEERTRRFLRGFQQVLILGREDLRLLGDGLRCAVTEALTELYRSIEAEEQPEDAEALASRLFSALRALSVWDLTALVEEADCVEAVLRRDPAGIYPKMCRESREYYRQCLARAAERAGIPEHRAAERVLEKAEGNRGERSHVGWWILEQPLGRARRRSGGGAYIASQVLLMLSVSLLLAFLCRSAAAFFLLLVPVASVVEQLTDNLLLRRLRPAHVPRMALKEGVPAEGRTLLVISALLTSPRDGPRFASRMEECMHLSRDAGRENLGYALLADLPDAFQAAEDGEDGILEAAAAAVRGLNEAHGGGFFLLTRPRSQSPEGVWRGWERKRGALLETMRALRSLPSGVTVREGDRSWLAGNVRFLLTLDGDTRLSPGAAKELIGAMLHPLNRPVLRQKDGVVVRGYGIVAPRIATELRAASKSDFSRIFSPQGGTDPYGGACSDLFMDLWRRGNYAGKGILDIDAYLACMENRVPENRMLSHDAVESAFLRTGFAGEIEVSDGCPGGILPWYARTERWVRGDWQNLMWLGRAGRSLPDAERWKLFCSLRRSLLPAATFASLLLGLLFPGLPPALAAYAALLSLLCELLLTVAETLFRRPRGRRERFHSALFVGIGGGLVRAMLRLLLLPGEAWTSFSAIARALWRTAVSHRRLLQWTTADQSERGRHGLLPYYRRLWLAPAAGGMLLLFSGSVIGRTAGVLWLLSPLCAWLLSLPAAPARELSEADRRYLLDCAGDTYAYFRKFLGAQDHFLPPDNYQAQPPLGLAHRTSPTNIGLGLLSVLAAADLGITPAETAAELIGNTLETVKALPKWKGHLYNWYQTETLEPLTPRYVSTVDSGNLCACLMALSRGLSEYNRPDLAETAAELAADMDFAPLFDRKRKLFSIGADIERGVLTESWYDLMSSEARLTGYLAVARGDVPREHWRRLSRAQVAAGASHGMASWTGTMFEYLMPELLLPLQRESLLYESAKFCLYAQRRRTRGTNRPWGISESAYGALDPSMSYRYKAHGCAALALKRGMDDELVISPYSSFLALEVSPAAAIRNLRELEKRDMRREFGFWEALDYTSSRLYARRPAVVRCVMAHHQGMSMVACANLLLDGIMQRRFLENSDMRAYLGLLQEKIPVGAPLLRRSVRSEPVRQRSVPREGWRETLEGTDFLHPRCCLLSGKTYSLLVSETGLVRPLWGAVSPYVPPASPLDAEKGVDIWLETEGRTQSLLPAPWGGETAPFRVEMATDCVRFTASLGALCAETCVTLSAEDTGERRDILLTNTGEREAEAALCLRLRPLLGKYADYVSHPAFAGLGVSARLRDGALLLRRLPRNGGRELWMCLAPSRPCDWDLAPGSASGRALAPLSATQEEFFLTDPCVKLSCALRLAPGGQERFTLAVALAYTETDALEAGARIGRETEGADLPQSAATVLGLEPEDVGRAFAMLPALCFPAAPESPVRREELWRFGISGDRPIAAAYFSERDQLSAARKLMDLHLFLCGCGLDFDLVFLTKDAAGYQKPLQNALGGAVWRQGGELLRDRSGGIHVLEDSPEASRVAAAAARRLNGGALPLPPERQTDYRVSALLRPRCARAGALPYEWENGAFRFTLGPALPPRCWQNVLSNGRMGFIATETGCGGMWYRNARENQIVPWLCRPYAGEGPERLFLSLDGRRLDLFAAPGGESCRVTYLPGAAVWEKTLGDLTVRTAAFIPSGTDCRVLLIQCSHPLPDTPLHWQLDLLLAGDRADAPHCRTAAAGGFLAAENVRAMAQARPFYAMATEPIRSYTFDRASALMLRYDLAEPQGAPVMAARLELRDRLVLVCGCDEPHRMLALTDPETAERALKETLEQWEALLGRFSLRSPALALDKLVNGWAGYQAIACRLLGRSSVYQSGGAYGFRDQLQDAVNVILLRSGIAREQILRCCSRQYVEGDVQHWWHEGGETPRGVRTRCSDDLLWLPWAVAEYVEKTGDRTVLTEAVPYLSSPPLAEGERDRYEAAPVSDLSETVWRHCGRAVACVMNRGTGPNGLLWMGSGDWNDGFDAAGGESVWLSWFFLLTAEKISPILERCGEDAGPLRAFCDGLANAAENAWDGEWYRRGYYASGAPMGSAGNRECRIDSLAQSFAVLCGRADPKRAGNAVERAAEALYDREHGLVRLFTPPFAGQEHPGYLESYGPGFRENGGQYTHGALWLVMALLRCGKTELGWELLRAMLPADKTPAPWECEPFVLSADVYAAPGHAGQAGWSWYTGAAGWMLRVVTEDLLGLRLRDGRLTIQPNLPRSWSGYTAVCGRLRIEVRETQVLVNGREWHGCPLSLG
ncbi:MAG: hypothetical protein IJU29_04670 [Oscillospiraceae bacterium]|nr:hypothetical protein [Oscillospiraceae bacterium]